MSILTLVVPAILLILAIFVVLLRTLLTNSEEPLPDPGWLASFSASRYRPMQRLLREDDYSFLAARGGSRSTIDRLRSERRRVFRAYLRNMVRDFNRLHRAARILSLTAETDRSDFAIQLLRIRLAFSWAVAVVQFRLALHSLGLGSVDARRLIRALDQMSTGYSSLTPAGQFAAG
jgi:hypothetical protein